MVWDIENALNELSFQANVRENIEELDLAKFKVKLFLILDFLRFSIRKCFPGGQQTQDMQRKHITKTTPKVGLQNRPSVTSGKCKVLLEVNSKASRDLKVVSWQPCRKFNIEKDSSWETGVWLLLVRRIIN